MLCQTSLPVAMAGDSGACLKNIRFYYKQSSVHMQVKFSGACMSWFLSLRPAPFSLLLDYVFYLDVLAVPEVFFRFL